MGDVVITQREVARTARRFWEKVEKSDGCWLWKGATRGRYGNFWNAVEKKFEYAHRASYVLHNGPIPPGHGVLHRCDTPLCVRPDHLFTGTDSVNFEDMRGKERHARGAVHGRAKLTDEQVRQIREKFETTAATQKEIADEFSVSFRTVHAVVRNKIWKHLL